MKHTTLKHIIIQFSLISGILTGIFILGSAEDYIKAFISIEVGYWYSYFAWYDRKRK